MNNKIWKCQGLWHKERYGEEKVELIGYKWFNVQIIDTEKYTVKPSGEREKLEYCQKCYDYNLPFMIERIYLKVEKLGFGFNPIKWFWFYEDDEKKQAEEDGKQLDYYYQQKALYHKKIALLKKDIEIIPWTRELDNESGQMIDVYVGDFGTRYCISCSTKKNDNSDKQLIMSLDSCKLCYSCGMLKARGLIDGSNSQLIIKERIKKAGDIKGTIIERWNYLDKQTFSIELQRELDCWNIKQNF